MGFPLPATARCFVWVEPQRKTQPWFYFKIVFRTGALSWSVKSIPHPKPPPVPSRVALTQHWICSWMHTPCLQGQAGEMGRGWVHRNETILHLGAAGSKGQRLHLLLLPQFITSHKDTLLCEALNGHREKDRNRNPGKCYDTQR